MIRKWMKRIVTGVLTVAVCLVGVHFILRALSGMEWTTRTVTEKLASATGREVRLGRLDLGINHLGIEDFSLAKEGGFEKGTDARINHLYVKVSWLHLLLGDIKIVAVRIDGLTLHVVRNAQGKLNFEFSQPDEQTPAQEPASDEGFSFPLDLRAEELSLRNTQLSYQDEVEELHVGLKDADLLVRDFSLDEPFEVRFNG